VNDSKVPDTEVGPLSAVLAIGGLLGYAAASSRLDAFRSADASPSQHRVPDKVDGPALRSSVGPQNVGTYQPALEKLSHSVKGTAGRAGGARCRTTWQLTGVGPGD